MYRCSRAGGDIDSRHSLSYLSNIGLTDAITLDRTEYVRTVRLGNDLSQLAQLRSGLRERIAQGPAVRPRPICRAISRQLAGRSGWRALFQSKPRVKEYLTLGLDKIAENTTRTAFQDLQIVKLGNLGCY